MNNTNNLESFEERKVRVDHLHYIFGIIATLLLVTMMIIARNPDTDAFFLINNGKYIYENHSVPTENVWTIHEGFKIVIQQWICSLLNYIAYATGGWIGIKILALLEAGVFNISLNKLINEYTNSKKIKIITMCICNLAFILFFTTRPYPITMSVVTYEWVLLNRLYNKKESGKSVAIKLCILSLFSINYQSATWCFLFIMILPYIVPWIFIKRKDSNKLYTVKPLDEEYDSLRDKEKHTRRILIKTIPFMLCLGLANPNGVEGIKYLWNSYSAVKDGAIMEMASPAFTSLGGGVLVFAIIINVITIIKNKEYSKPLIYTFLGTTLMAMMSGRNNWLLLSSMVPSMSFLLSNLVADDVPKKTFKLNRAIIICEYLLAFIVLIAISLGVVSACVQNLDKYEKDDMAQYLNTLNKEDIKLFTGFNTGAYFELQGYKVYMDARPELYQKVINGKEDIYDEYTNMKNGKIDIEEFLDKYEFTHLVVQRPSVLDTYLYYSNDYKVIVEDEECRLYERVRGKEKDGE